MARASLRILTFVLLMLLANANAKAQNNVQFRPEPLQAATSLPGEGSEFFRALLHIRGIKPVKESELATLTNFGDVMVIVLGTPHERHFNVNNLRGQFHRNMEPPNQIIHKALSFGAAILIASDVFYQFNITGGSDKIAGTRVECRDPEATLRGLHDCPFAVPLAGPKRTNVVDLQAEARKLFDGDEEGRKKLDHVAAGLPSYIHLDQNGNPPSLIPLARFPSRTFATNNGRDNLLAQQAYFAVGGELMHQHSLRQFRFLALASSKVFNNGLMYLATAEKPEDQTDNLELCFRAIEYLQGPNQHKKRCVFFENGQLIEHFDDLARATARQSIPMPSPNLEARQKSLIDTGKRLVDVLEPRDAPNQIFNNILPLRSLVTVLLWLAAVSACWYIFKRALGLRKPSDIPPAPTIASATSDPPGVFDRRQKELLRRNNVYEPVRDLIREFFVSVGIHGEPGAKLPKLKISRGVRKPDSLQLAIKDLWRLAYGEPQLLGINQWRDLEPYFERVRQAHADKKWAFAFEMVH